MVVVKLPSDNLIECLMRYTIRLAAGCLCLAAMLFGSAAFAQSSSLFGNRTLGSGISSNASGGSSSFGQYGGSSGTSGLSGLSGLSSGTSGIQSAQSSAGQVTSDARYLPQNRQGAFVGADSRDTTNPLSQQSGVQQGQLLQSQNAFFSQLSQQLQRNQNQQRQQNGRNGNTNQQQVRVSLKLGFAGGGSVSSATTAQLEKRFTRLPGLNLVSPVQVVVEKDVVVLRGRVASQSDRELAEAIARMEPGIEDVRNELSVGPAGSTDAESLPSP